MILLYARSITAIEIIIRSLGWFKFWLTVAVSFIGGRFY